jgi:hypothetical protein
MKVISLELKAGHNPYDTNRGAPRMIVPNSFKAGAVTPAPHFSLLLVVDQSIPSQPCSFNVVGVNEQATGSFLGQAGSQFLFSDCFGSI